MQSRWIMVSKTWGWCLTAGAVLAWAVPSVARADEVPPPSPLVAESPPAPPPGPNDAPPAAPESPPAKKIAPPVAPVDPGSMRGLYSADADERLCEIDRCLCGIPEIRMPIYDPTSRIQLPWTGQYNPCERNWTFFAAESLTYNDNLFASQNQVESDWISNSSVGVSYRREGAAYWALATGALTYSKYFDHSEEDGLNAYANFQFGWKGGATYWSIKDSFGYLQNPIVVRDNTFTIINQRLEHYWQNTLTANVGYDCSCWRAELSYVFDYFHGNDGGVIDAFNHTDHGFSGRFDYYVSEKTSIGAYAGYRIIPYTDPTQRDFNVWSAGGTFSWRPTAIFGVSGSVGASGTQSTGAGSDNTSYATDIDASWDSGPSVSYFLGWSHSFEPSLGADDQLLDSVHLRAQAVLDQCWTLGATLGVQFGNTQGATPINGTKDYTLLFLDLNVHRPIGDRWAADFGYQLRQQDSSENGIDFDQNIFTVGFSVSL